MFDEEPLHANAVGAEVTVGAAPIVSVAVKVLPGHPTAEVGVMV